MKLKHLIEGCIYKIVNINTNKVYIGSASNGFARRKRVHITCLNKNKHHSKKLQNSFNKHGINSFVFEEIEKCSLEDILVKEQEWINYYDSYNNGYNSCPIAGNCEGRKVSQETRDKISRSLKGKKVFKTKEQLDAFHKLRLKPILQYTLGGSFIREFNSATEASLTVGFSQGYISNVCLGKYKCSKFIFKFKNNETT